MADFNNSLSLVKYYVIVKAATHKNKTREQLFVDEGINLPPRQIISWLGYVVGGSYVLL